MVWNRTFEFEFQKRGHLKKKNTEFWLSTETLCWFECLGVACSSDTIIDRSSEFPLFAYLINDPNSCCTLPNLLQSFLCHATIRSVSLPSRSFSVTHICWAQHYLCYQTEDQVCGIFKMIKVITNTTGDAKINIL